MPNTDKEFWTDANVIDFAYSVRHNDNFKDGIALSKGTIDELAKEFKRGKEKLDYQILSLRKYDGYGTYEEVTLRSNGSYLNIKQPLLEGFYSLQSTLFEGWKIHSVKRSDGEVFTIGDKVNYGEIEKFFMGWTGMEVHFTDGCGATLRSIERKKKPLFTTEDKIDIYEGDEYVKVNDYSDYSIVTGFTAHGNHNDYKGIRFSTKEVAKDFVLMNKPCLSVNHVSELYSSLINRFANKTFEELLIELAKEKMI